MNNFSNNGMAAKASNRPSESVCSGCGSTLGADAKAHWKACSGRAIRLWIWHHGSPVRVTLRVASPADPYHLTTHEHEPTDEGYYARSRAYSLHRDGSITLDTWERWRDCDGRGETSSSYVSSRERAAEITPTSDVSADHPDVEGWPAWDVLDVRHRDHTAESMGY